MTHLALGVELQRNGCAPPHALLVALPEALLARVALHQLVAEVALAAQRRRANLKKCEEVKERWRDGRWKVRVVLMVVVVVVMVITQRSIRRLARAPLCTRAACSRACPGCCGTCRTRAPGARERREVEDDGCENESEWSKHKQGGLAKDDKYNHEGVEW
jgi:hypothetical protein